jgi:hypothetical protein
MDGGIMATKYISLTDAERKEILKALPPTSKLRSKIERAGERIKVRSAKAKGMSFQREVCQRISDLIGIPYLRGDDDSLIESRGGGQHGVDIILRGEAKKRFPFSIEAKNQENMNLVDTVKQAQENQVEGTTWMIVHRRKALPVDLVIMSWELFEVLYGRKAAKRI